jgi:hypothetical protein
VLLLLSCHRVIYLILDRRTRYPRTSEHYYYGKWHKKIDRNKIWLLELFGLYKILATIGIMRRIRRIILTTITQTIRAFRLIRFSDYRGCFEELLGIYEILGS